MKYKNKHYYEAPRIFWPVKNIKAFDDKLGRNTYKVLEDDPYLRYYRLSVYAKWLYHTLKEMEHRYVDMPNKTDYMYFNGVDDPSEWFYAVADKIALLSGLSRSSVKRAKKELQDAGLIETCVVFVLQDHKRVSTHLTGYRIVPEQDIPWQEYEGDAEYGVELTRGYIYVMRHQGYYKIGKTVNCNRLGEYTKLPEEPEYVYVVYVNDMTKMETRLHKMFQKKRCRNGTCEWFSLNDSDLQHIQALLKEDEVVDFKHTSGYRRYVLHEDI